MNPADNFRDLLLMAASDGQVDEAELRLLADRAAQWGVGDDEFEAAIQDAIAGRAELVLPPDPQERIEILKDLIRMMAADGRMAEPEMRLFAIASTAIGIEGDELDRLIDDVVKTNPGD